MQQARNSSELSRTQSITAMFLGGCPLIVMATLIFLLSAACLALRRSVTQSMRLDHVESMFAHITRALKRSSRHEDVIITRRDAARRHNVINSVNEQFAKQAANLQPN